MLNCIVGSLTSALRNKSTVKVYRDLDRLQAPGGGTFMADVLMQSQRPDLVILDGSVPSPEANLSGRAYMSLGHECWAG